jgi:alkyl sulfatase BDS1-like metallo-beta-lactamase superfamily hydrolase
MFFDYLGVRLNAPKTASANAVLNFDFGDSGGTYLIEMENGVLNHTANKQSDTADATVTLTRDTLNKVILGETKLAEAISAGDVEVSGDKSKLDVLVSNLDSFAFWFNIVTP